MPKDFLAAAKKASHGVSGYKVRTIHPKGRPDVYLHVVEKPNGHWIAGETHRKKRK